MHNRFIIILFSLIIIIGGAATALAQYEEMCQMCHADESIEPVTERGAILDLYLPVETYEMATHGNMECTLCHVESEEGGFEEFPHLLDKSATPMCLDCHGEEFEDIHDAYELSYHAKNIKEFSCFNCHDIHRANFDSLTQDYAHEIQYYNQKCYHCHVDSAIYAYYSGKDASKLDLSHSFLPSREVHWRSVRCVECHTPADQSNVHDIVAGDQAQHKCVACHSQNTLLTRKLYKRTATTDAGDQDNHKIMNYFLFQNAYVIGATRLTIVDTLVLILFIAAFAGVVGHGLLRVVLVGKKDYSKGYELHTEYLYKLETRLWHWTNALLFIVLIATGFSLHFSTTRSIIDFSLAVHVHNWAARILIVAYLFYLIMNFVDGNIKQYIPGSRNILHRLFLQARYYAYGCFKKEDKPFKSSAKHKFNPLQRMSYLAVMFFFFPVIITTGLLLMFPDSVPTGLLGVAGLGAIAIAHYITAVFLVLFMIVHIYLGTTGDKVFFLYQAMLNGYHKAFQHKAVNDQKEE